MQIHPISNFPPLFPAKKAIAVLILVFSAFWAPQYANAQNDYNLLEDKKRLRQVQQAIQYMYNWEFDKAEKKVEQFSKNIPPHPAVPFSKAMIIYWKMMPIDFTDKRYEKHVELLEEATDLAEQRLEEDEDDIEGQFFKMASRSLLMKHLADAGKPMKAVSEAKAVYKLMKNGFDLKEEFIEYYFTTGVYNYYREYYPEKYPIYKPFAMFFQSGDMSKGLEQLVYAARNATFTQAEAYSYLSYIYLRYEKNPEKAIEFARELTSQYPDNLYFQVIKTEILFLSGRYDAVESQIPLFIRSSDPYYQAVGHMFAGMLLEKEDKLNQAMYRLKKAEKLVDNMKYRFIDQKVYLYYTLANCYARQDKNELAKEYYKKAKDYDNNKYLKEVEKPNMKN